MTGKVLKVYGAHVHSDPVLLLTCVGGGGRRRRRRTVRRTEEEDRRTGGGPEEEEEEEDPNRGPRTGGGGGRRSQEEEEEEEGWGQATHRQVTVYLSFWLFAPCFNSRVCRQFEARRPVGQPSIAVVGSFPW